jgi:hypothetical protein
VHILFSKYNLPFCEPSSVDVHYISLDDQRAIRSGEFDSHVHAFRAQPVTRILEIVDPLTGSTFTHDMSGSGFFRPFNSSPSVDRFDIDLEFIDDLRSSKVKAASRVYQCTCGNSRRPWRCTCHK